MGIKIESLDSKAHDFNLLDNNLNNISEHSEDNSSLTTEYYSEDDVSSLDSNLQMRNTPTVNVKTLDSFPTNKVSNFMMFKTEKQFFSPKKDVSKLKIDK